MAQERQREQSRLEKTLREALPFMDRGYIIKVLNQHCQDLPYLEKKLENTKETIRILKEYLKE